MGASNWVIADHLAKKYNWDNIQRAGFYSYLEAQEEEDAKRYQQKAIDAAKQARWDRGEATPKEVYEKYRREFEKKQEEERQRQYLENHKGKAFFIVFCWLCCIAAVATPFVYAFFFR